MFNIKDQIQALRSTIISLTLLIAITVLGVIWISFGMYFCLANFLEPAWAAVVCGLICFIPIIVFSLVKTFGSTQRQPAASTAEPEFASMATIVDSLAGHSPFLVAAVGLVAGFLVNRFPSVLRVFLEFLSAYSDDVKARRAGESGTRGENFTDKNVSEH